MPPSNRASRARPLAVGDLCLTCNSENSPRNNGLLVVIVQILRRSNGRLAAHPYRIRRIDGQPFPALGGWGRPLHLLVFTHALTRARHLRRLPPEDPQVAVQVQPDRRAATPAAPNRACGPWRDLAPLQGLPD